MELRELFEIARDNAKKLFLENGYDVSPMWHMVFDEDDNEVHGLVMTPWNSDEEKDEAVAALRELFAAKNVKMFAFICEAWVVEYRGDRLGKPLGPQPSLHPDRREVLRITAEERNGGLLSGAYYILRPEHGPPTLSPFDEHDDYVGVTGRMTGLLKPEPTRLQ